MRESSASCGAGEWSSLVRRWAGSPQARSFQTFQPIVQIFWSCALTEIGWSERFESLSSPSVEMRLSMYRFQHYQCLGKVPGEKRSLGMAERSEYVGVGLMLRLFQTTSERKAA